MNIHFISKSAWWFTVGLICITSSDVYTTTSNCKEQDNIFISPGGWLFVHGIETVISVCVLWLICLVSALIAKYNGESEIMQEVDRTLSSDTVQCFAASYYRIYNLWSFYGVLMIGLSDNLCFEDEGGLGIMVLNLIYAALLFNSPPTVWKSETVYEPILVEDENESMEV